MISSERFSRSFFISMSAFSIIGCLVVCDVRGSSGFGMDRRDSKIFSIMVMRRRLLVADGPVVRHSCLSRIVFRSDSGKWLIYEDIVSVKMLLGLRV